MSFISTWMNKVNLDAIIEVAPGWVTAMKGELSGETVVVVAGARKQLPMGAITASLTASNVRDRNEVIDAMRSTLGDVAGNPRRVALVIPDLAVRVSIVSFDRVPKRREDFEELIRWRNRRAVPFPIEEAVIGYTAVGGEGDDVRRFAVVLARRKVVREYEGLCADLGAQAGIVDISTLAAINVIFGTKLGFEGDCLIVHLRPEYTSLAIMRDERLLFFRTRTTTQSETVLDLVHQAEMYYQDRLDGQRFAHVFLGGQCQEESLLDKTRRMLDERLGVKVKAMNPSMAVTLPETMIEDKALVEVSGPLAGMLLRAQNETVRV
jgi:hypothetical protein